MRNTLRNVMFGLVGFCCMSCFITRLLGMGNPKQIFIKTFLKSFFVKKRKNLNSQKIRNDLKICKTCFETCWLSKKKTGLVGLMQFVLIPQIFECEIYKQKGKIKTYYISLSLKNQYVTLSIIIEYMIHHNQNLLLTLNIKFLQ